MTFHLDISKDAATGVHVTSTPKGLTGIADQSCPAVIWRRQPQQHFQDWIDAIAPGDLPRARIMLRPERVRDAMTDIVSAYDMQDCAEREMLVDDVAALAIMFTDVMSAPYLRLRLDVITTNACRKFHIDALRARMICTYRGSGTQYGFGQVGQDPEEVLEVPTGSPMMMRGTAWPTTPDTGFLHRSPPIEGTGETRLVLVLDPVADLEAVTDQHFVH